MKRKLVVLFMLVFAAWCSVVAQQTQTAKPAAAKPVAKAPAKPTPNDDIIAMVKQGMSEKFILDFVNKSDKSKYDTSGAGIVKLVKAGVPENVITAMQGSGVAPASSAPVSQNAPAPPPTTVVVQAPAHIGVSLDAPSTISLDGREAGIYLAMGKDLEQLEPSVYSGGKSGNKLWAHVPIVGTASLKAVVRSAAANQRVQTSMPTFYFFFEVKGAGLSNTGGTFAGYMNSASSPNEFVLMRMKVSTDEREVMIAKSSILDDRTGVASKDTVDIAIKKLRPGVYEVKPRNPLQPGEYCFFYQGGTADKGGVGKLFDFGVNPGASIQQ